jgi:hypothetical protein
MGQIFLGEGEAPLQGPGPLQRLRKTARLLWGWLPMTTDAGICPIAMAADGAGAGEPVAFQRLAVAVVAAPYLIAYGAYG